MTDRQYQAWLAALDALRTALSSAPVFDRTACGTAINNSRYHRNKRGVYVPRDSAAMAINTRVAKSGHNGGPK